jgi:glutathione synthase/RimK-type ligase-like ATP-grasp enzyme
MNFLIVTEPSDTHAIITTLVLESLGHKVINLFSGDFPTKQQNSVFIDQKVYECNTQDDFQSLHHVGYDVVWWRRPRPPVLNKALVHPDDYKFHHRESLLFHENFTHQLAPGAWWINRKEASIRSSYKLLQLKIASEVGLIIPTTLCSNNKEEILSFYKQYSKKGIIYKPLSYQFWEEDGKFRALYTSKIKDIQLLEENIFQFFPGIYQEQIPKKYELRVTCFGDYIVAARLNSQTHEYGREDWRVLEFNDLEIEPYSLPEHLKQQIRFLMRELGIVFGCLDFIVTPDNQYIFLEVNEQGQFLFLEEACDDLPMLDIFVGFLLQQTVDYYWVKKEMIHRIQDYKGDIQKIFDRNSKLHLSGRLN